MGVMGAPRDAGAGHAGGASAAGEPGRASAAGDAGPARAAAAARALLLRLFDAAAAAADPARLLPGRLPPPRPGRTVVVGAGKAAASMAAAFERDWPHPLEGLVVTRYGHGVPCTRIEVVEAAHPVPDAAGPRAAARILELAEGLGADDLLVCLTSGGGSSLLALPAAGLTLADKQDVNRRLLRSGATIAEMNCVRKHLSAVKGGRLAAAAHPARVVTYLISDVPGDDPSVIASGPTVPDPTTFADALAVLERYGIDGPAAVLDHLRAGAAGRVAETPKPDDPGFAADELVMLATARSALEAAAAAARDQGLEAVILGDDLEGEARELGGRHALLALATLRGGESTKVALREAAAGGAAHLDEPVSIAPRPPLVYLSGGETTVTVTGGGRGGRNAEYLLGLVVALDGIPGVSALACDTDGIDGTEDNAGAVAGPDTLECSRTAGLDAVACLAANDAYGLFAALGDLVVTGPTRTNVNDFRAILIEAPPRA